MEEIKINGMAHITGGGITENLPRIMNSNLKAQIKINSWEQDPIFEWLATNGNIADSEMKKTFNCGIGMILIVDKKDTKKTLSILNECNELAWEIGTIVEGSQGVEYI